MNVALDCPDCWFDEVGFALFRERRVAEKDKYGIGEFDHPLATATDVRRRWLTVTWSGTRTDESFFTSGPQEGHIASRYVTTMTGSGTMEKYTGAYVSTGLTVTTRHTSWSGITGEEISDETTTTTAPIPPASLTVANTNGLGWGPSTYVACPNPTTLEELPASEDSTTTRKVVLSNELTNDTLIADVFDALAAIEDWTTAGITTGSSRVLSTSNLNFRVVEERYTVRVPVFTLASIGRKKYTVRWVERFIPHVPFGSDDESGVSVTSVEVLKRGVYRPLVRIYPAEEGVDGEGAWAVAVMALDGSVASVRLLNPGFGYTGGAEVWFSEADGDDAVTAEGTVTVDTDPDSPNYGHVLSVEITNAGNYLPTLLVPQTVGSTEARVSCTMDPDGGIKAVTVDDAGANFQYFSTFLTYNITVQRKCGYYTGDIAVEFGREEADLDARFFVHMGEEEAFKRTWSGDPKSFDLEDSDTWPALIEDKVLAMPEEDGYRWVIFVEATASIS